MVKIKYVLLLFIVQFTFGQDHFITFIDKPFFSTDLEHPEEFLSQKSLLRRENQGIDLIEKDAPVYDVYLDSLKKLSCNVYFESRWFNGAICQCDKDSLQSIKSKGFVAQVFDFSSESLKKEVSRPLLLEQPENVLQTEENNVASQLSQLNLTGFHNKGFDGNGVSIAIIDAGFKNYSDLEIFDSIFDQNRLIETFDFVFRDSIVSNDHEHGTHVFSILAGHNDTFSGSAPKASFALYRTEDVYKETPIEELLWTVAAERADEIGIDVINASLGYFDFDNSVFNYVYEDMDGKTTFISQAAKWAAQTGMIIVTGAGNEGINAWKYITAPADSPYVLAVGAVNNTGVKWSGSSVGPTSDGRIKPDLCANGQNTFYYSFFNNLQSGNGTSYASPLIAGFVACIRQAFPTKTEKEIREIAIRSCDRYSQPDNNYGYGIPNALVAYDLLLNPVTSLTRNKISITPNLVSDVIELDFEWDEEFSISIYSLNGELIYLGNSNQNIIDVKQLVDGFYMIRISNSTLVSTQKILIQNHR